MKRFALAAAGTICAGMLFCGCASGAGAGRVSAGTERIFDASQATVVSAITNAFHHYDDMLLVDAVGHDFLARGWHPTSGFLLMPGTFSSYHGFLYIDSQPQAGEHTKVIVKTILAQAVHGMEPGVHGGWAFHYKKIPPDPKQEEKVLEAITQELQTTKKR